MFMTPREIRKNYSMGDAQVVKKNKANERESTHDVLQRKYGAATSEFVQSIREQGVQYPVQLSYEGDRFNTTRPKVREGHHRLAVSDRLAPDRLIPVQHHATAHKALDAEDATWLASRRSGFPGSRAVVPMSPAGW